MCHHNSSDTIWKINSQDIVNFRATSTSIIGPIHILTISAPSHEYNKSIIECIANVEGDSTYSEEKAVPPATLLLQGWYLFIPYLLLLSQYILSHHGCESVIVDYMR